MTQFLIQHSPAGNVRGVTASFAYQDKDYVTTFTHLLADGDDNVKLAKGNRLKRYKTYGLSLAPARESGYQTCPRSSAGCREGCIFRAGYAQVFDRVNVGRVARTLMWFEEREAFERLLRQDLELVQKVAASRSRTAAVRLNVFSDLPWERTSPWIFDVFPRIRYFDYSKLISRVLSQDLPPNYDLTFSRSESNDEEVAEVLARGGRVAVVFGIKPNRWKQDRPKVLQVSGRDYRVVDGDRHDLRFLDPKGVVVGLYAKGKGRKDTSGFVLQPKAGEWSLGRPKRYALSIA